MAGERQNRSVVPDMGNFSSIVSRRLQRIYNSDFSESIVNRILSITSVHYHAFPQPDESDILLITYGNSILRKGEKPLRTLLNFSDAYLADCINCIHILPFFPYTSDDGFAVSDFTTVNPELGNWDDIARLSENYSLMVDLVLNHVSSEHRWFKNFLTGQAPGKGYFIEAVDSGDYSMVIRPRSTPLFSVFETQGGLKKIWTTFSKDQTDLNFSNPEVLLEMIRIMVFLIGKGARFIRLDAIAYIWKREGTPCLHLNEVHEIVKLLRDIASYVCPGAVIITETNVPNTENWSYFGNGDEAHMVYQFSLPPLLLYTFFSEDSCYLNDWAAIIPETKADQSFLNYTASHDGIGVRPLEGLIPDGDMAQLIEAMVSFGGKISMKTNRGGTLSPYEINITYFDAMKGAAKGIDQFQPERFICSQTIMMAMKGLPAFYIHSLLATPNDIQGVELTGRARSINRKQLQIEELETDLHHNTVRSEVFNKLKLLIKIRRRHKAFHPAAAQYLIRLDSKVFAFIRENRLTGEEIICISNISTVVVTIPKTSVPDIKEYDLISNSYIANGDHILLNPFQTVWLTKAPI